MNFRIIENQALVDGAKLDNLPDDTQSELDGKQDILVSGTNIKTVNGNSLLGSGNITISAGVSSVNGENGDVVLTQDDIGDGTTYKQFSATEKTKLAGIEAGAEVNNLSDSEATDLTDGGDTALHTHDGRYYTESEVDTLLNGKEDTLGYNPLQSVVAGTNVTIDNTDPLNPVINASGGGGGGGDVTAFGTLTNDTVILGNGTTSVKSSSKTIVTTLGSDDTTLPTSKAVKDVTDTKANSFTTVHTSTSVNPATPFTTYLVDASSGNVTITLPNATNNTDEYRIVLEEDTHYIEVTTVGGTQLIGGKTSQIIHTVGGGLYIKSSTDHYDIISDTRGLERIVDITTDTDLSISGYENSTTYHIIPSGGTITVTLPDSSSIIEGTNVRFTLHGTGTCIVKTDSLELIEGQQEQTITENGAIRLVNDGTHYWIDTDTRPKVQNSAVTFYSLNEDSAISDGLGGYYKQSSTSTTDARYSGTATVVNTGTIGTDTYLFGGISDEGVIQGILPEGPATTTVNIARNTGSASFRFYIKFYKYSGGVETLIGTSSMSNVIDTTTLSEYIVTTNIAQTSFLSTDRIIRKLFATSSGSPTAKVSIEGASPSFSTISSPSTSIAHNTLAGIQQAGNGVTNGHISDTTQIIAGLKTLSEGVQLEKEIINKQIATPSNPSAGYNKLYFKSDDKLYKLDNAGVESEVGGLTGTVPVTSGGTGLSTIADKTLLVTSGANTLSALTIGAGQSIRRNAGDTAFEAYTPSSGASQSTQSTFVAGENITAGMPVRKGNTQVPGGGNEVSIIQNTTNETEYIGYTTSTQYEHGQSFTATKTGLLKSIGLYLSRNNTPNHQINVEIFSDSGFTTLIGTSNETLSAGSLSTSSTLYTFTFNSVSLVNTTVYYFKVNIISGTTSTTNYIKHDWNSTSVYTGGIAYYINSGGTVGAFGSGDFRFNIIQADPEDITKVFKTSAISTTTIKCCGFAAETITSGNNIKIDTTGVNSNQSGLTTDATYYLGDTAGTISTTPGTNSVKIGRAISSTELLIIYPPL